MNLFSSPSDAGMIKTADCQGTLARVATNLSGFLYCRQLDARWTMEFLSAGARDITGYDPHRFIANASIAFGDLISRADRQRVEECVRTAVLRRQRAKVEYRIRTAHGAWLRVEDRFTPVVNATGQVLAIEGIIDRARHTHIAAARRSSIARSLAALRHSNPSN